MSIERSIRACEASLIEATQEIIKIKSVKENPQPGAPFGLGPVKCLEFVLDLAKSFGLETENLDNYVGWAQWGQGPEMIAILVHLDVVPEGSDWTYPPYGGEIHDGRIYGRGAVDNKGPAMAALFALKALKDSGSKCHRRVRVIFGTDEESGFECIKYYKEFAEMPTMGFSPDAEFPIINGEKGILTFKFSTEFERCTSDGVEIASLIGGHRHNMVPDFAKATLRGDIDKIKELVEIAQSHGENLKLEVVDDEVEVSCCGVSAHGSTPEKGTNAVMVLLRVMGELDLVTPQRELIGFLNKSIGEDTTGSGLEVNLSDEVSGDLTFNVGVAYMDRETASFIVNIRYPISYNGDDVLDKIKENTPKAISVDLLSNTPPHFVPEDKPIIQKLKAAYEEITGHEAYCFTIGGGTYARLFENCVAFGPSFPGDPELAHKKDEYIDIGGLIKNLHIYARVLEHLVSPHS